MEPRISSALRISQQAIQQIQDEAAELIAIQVESEEDLAQYFELAVFNPLVQVQRFRNLREISSKDSSKTESSEEAKEAGESPILEVTNIDEISERFQKRNYELNAKTLQILRSQIQEGDSADIILQKVDSVYKEAALADEALEFLLETTEGQLLASTQEAKDKLNKDKGKEIRAGRNMGAQAREFSKQGLGSPQSLRELYRDITQNPREPLKLFDELTERFHYEKLKPAIGFMLHSLGSDLKSKGPSIQRVELKRLLDEARSMQGILGIFRFFQSRMKLIQREFESYQLLMPPKLTFELLAKTFAKLIAERFMNQDKILATAKNLGISEETAAQIIIYTQMKDALKQIAPKYFRDPKHRDELLQAFMDTLEYLDEKLEEETEE
jgi:type III secretion protein W